MSSVELENNHSLYPPSHGNQSAAPSEKVNLEDAKYKLPTNLSLNIEEEETSDDDAFEKLEMDGKVTGLVIPLQYTNPETGEVTELWGSIDNDGLFDIIDGHGKTHPLMHPLALEACIEIALDWQYIDLHKAEQIIQAHLKLAKQLHTPQIIDMIDGNQMAQVMTGYAELAKRYKVGAYGAMGLDSQGQFIDYVGPAEIMEIMTQAAEGNPKLKTDLSNLIEFNSEIIQQMAGEIEAMQAPAFSESKVATDKEVVKQAAEILNKARQAYLKNTVILLIQIKVTPKVYSS